MQTPVATDDWNPKWIPGGLVARLATIPEPRRTLSIGGIVPIDIKAVRGNNHAPRGRSQTSQGQASEALKGLLGLLLECVHENRRLTRTIAPSDSSPPETGR